MPKLYDSTQLDALARCEAEHGYRYQQHLARVEPDASAFFGQVVHVGVRNLFAGTHEPDGLAQAWGEFVAPPNKAHLTLQYAQAIVEMYAAQHFPSKQFDLVLNEHYLEHPERSLCGIVDRVVRSKADGQLYVMDLKTTGLYLSQAWFEQWRHSLQAAIYLDLVEAFYANGNSGDRGSDRQGVLGESDQRGGYARSGTGNPSTTETPRSRPQPVAGFWVDAIHVNRRGYPKPEDFMRVGPFAYSRELRSELRDVVDALVARAKELEQWPGGAMKNPRSCWRFSALCPYFQFCTLNVADRTDAVKMATLAGDFVTMPWEPANRK